MKKLAFAFVAALAYSAFAQAPAAAPAAPAAAPAAAPVAQAPAPAAAPVAEAPAAPAAAPAAAPVAEAAAPAAVTEPAPEAAPAAEVAAPTAEEIAAAEAAKKAEEEAAAAEAAKKAEEEKAAAEAAKKAEEEAAAEAAKKAEEEAAAAEAAKKDETPSASALKLGATASAGFGTYNIKYGDSYFQNYPFTLGLSGLYTSGSFGVRLALMLDYDRLYVTSGSSAINEGYWRLSAGLYGRYMPKNSGLVVELGATCPFLALTDVDLQMYASPYATSVYKPLVTVDVEAGVGYQLNLGSAAVEVGGYFGFDILESMRFTQKDESRAWKVGARANFWFLNL